MSTDNNDRREARKRRRVRNQVICYIILILIIAMLAVAAYFGIKQFIKLVSKSGEAPSVTASQNEAESVSEAAIISTPDMEEIVSENVVADVSENVVENAAARAYIDSMTTEQKVAAVFMVTPESITGVNTVTQAGEGTRSALADYGVCGILYSSKNVSDETQFKDMISTTRGMYSEVYGAPLWIAVEENGTVNTIAGRVAGEESTMTPGDIGLQENGAGAAGEAYSTIGNRLNSYDVDMNLALNCSLTVSENGFLGNETYSDDPDMVASMVRNSVENQNAAGVITCIGAFPGEGYASVNPAEGVSTIDRSLEDMRNNEFVPFVAGMDAGAEIVIMSNAMAPEVSGEAVPCSLSSKVINDTLRHELGFEGIVITGRLDDKSITGQYTAGESAVMALNAGADILLCPADFEGAYNGVLEAVNTGTVNEERLDDALMHIYSLKFAKQ